MKNLSNQKLLGKKLGNSLKEWILDSTSHGFPKIFKTDRVALKIMWTFGLLVSVGLCSFLIARSIIDYTQYDVTTIIRKQSKIPIELPAISICNTEMFVTQKGRDFVEKVMKRIDVQDPLNSSFFSTYFASAYQESYNLLTLDYLSRLNALDYNLSNIDRQMFGLSLEDFMVTCFVSGVDCKYEDFVWYFDDVFGNCYLFNSGKLENGSSSHVYTQSNIGFYFGITFELLSKNNRNRQDSNLPEGYHITIFDRKSKINSLRGVGVSPNFQTNIHLKKRVTKKIPEPYSDCVEDTYAFRNSEIYQATLKLSEYYSQEQCYGVCYQDFLISRCNCTDPNKQFYKPIENCLNLPQIYCAYVSYVEFYSNIDPQEICSKHCPLECENTAYDYTISFNKYPTDLQAKSLQILMNKRNTSNNFSFEDIKNNVLQVNIYYDVLEYETIEEAKKMELVDLISNIGGLLGLFIGISILSFAELIEIFIEIIYILFIDTGKNKVIQVQSP